MGTFVPPTARSSMRTPGQPHPRAAAAIPPAAVRPEGRDCLGPRPAHCCVASEWTDVLSVPPGHGPAGCVGEALMSTFQWHRSTPHDVDALRDVCAQLSHERGSLLAARREALDPARWIAQRVPLTVVSEGAQVIGFAGAVPEGQAYSSPRCAELVVGVVAKHRRRGAGRVAVVELLTTARTMGLWKLVVFALPEDVAARALVARADFREVGTLEKHVQLEGVWRSVSVHERILMAARPSNPSIGG
jgi:L-amino acid N-acyltransferase YncA